MEYATRHRLHEICIKLLIIESNGERRNLLKIMRHTVFPSRLVFGALSHRQIELVNNRNYSTRIVRTDRTALDGGQLPECIVHFHGEIS